MEVLRRLRVFARFSFFWGGIMGDTSMLYVFELGPTERSPD